MKKISIIPEISENIFSERFGQIDDFFSKLTGKIPLGDFPNYNIKRNKDEINIIISVPGFSESELDVSIKNKILIINGKKIEEESKNNDIIYEGILQKNFSLRFNLNNNVKFLNAKLDKGLLIIFLKEEIPDEEKIQKIKIES